MKKTKFRRILSLMLALAAIGSSAILAACNDDGGAGETTVNEDLADEYLDNVLPTDTYDGETLGLIGSAGLDFEPQEEENAQPVHDALLRRNAKIQERYDVEFKYYSLMGGGAECNEKLSTASLANESLYDVALGNFKTVGVYGVNNSLLLSSSNFEYVDLSQDWWSQDCTNQLRLGDKTFFLSGPILYGYTTDGSAIFFNKKLTENKSLDNHFELVRNKQWTLDKMTENMKEVAHDDNGDTLMDENDTWGIVIGTRDSRMIYYGVGVRIIEFDDAHEPYVIDDVTAVSTKIDKIYELLTNRKYVANVNFAEYAATDDNFIAGKSLYGRATVSSGIDYRAEDFYDFGIIPTPLWSETQESYYSWADTAAGGGIFFPITNQKETMTGVIVEALAYQSSVENGYYYAILEKYIKGRGTYDMDSEEMVDLVLDTKFYDLCQIFSLGLDDVLDSCATGDYGDGPSISLATSFAGKARTTSRALRSTLKQWNSLD